MAKGIDCSKPLTADTARSLAAEGYGFAARYLVPVRYAWKRLTPDEAHAITSAGLRIVSIYETAVRRPSGGSLAGRGDGKAAFREAQAVRQPSETAVYFAVDYDAQPDDYDAIEAYLIAAAAEMPDYRTGVYGSYAVIEEMVRRGACRHFWQTYAWSRGKKSAHANLYQYQNHVRAAGITVDLNDSFGDEGWWHTGGLTMPVGLSKPDADAMLRILQAVWQEARTPEQQSEIHRLANVLRQVSGQPTE